MSVHNGEQNVLLAEKIPAKMGTSSELRARGKEILFSRERMYSYSYKKTLDWGTKPFLIEMNEF